MNKLSPGCITNPNDLATAPSSAASDFAPKVCTGCTPDALSFQCPAHGHRTVKPQTYVNGDKPAWEGVEKLTAIPPIEYHMSNREFMLKIPVEALAGMSADAHTRMLAMLNDWMSRHKPVAVVK